MKYSEDLVKEYKEYMKKQYAFTVSDEQAQLDLDNLGGLYLAFTKTTA